MRNESSHASEFDIDQEPSKRQSVREKKKMDYASMDKGNMDSSNAFSYDTFGGNNKANPRKVP